MRCKDDHGFGDSEHLKVSGYSCSCVQVVLLMCICTPRAPRNSELYDSFMHCDACPQKACGQ
eukprot:1148610-Amphidinium_carterae.1